MNSKIKKILPQIATLLVVVLIFGFFTINAQINMDNRGIEFGFDFLSLYFQLHRNRCACGLNDGHISGFRRKSV